MENRDGNSHLIEESDVDPSPIRAPPPTSHKPHLSNGQCVLAMPSCSMLSPSFDLSLCRAKLEMDGFQIPVSDFEAPLQVALDVPSVRRFVVFNSALFHLVMAPMLYAVVWCAVFSTLHLYISLADYWVLCLCVSLISIFITIAIIFILHRSNKEINVNLDVRLILVNERMVKHKLLVTVADWVQNCTGKLQLCIVYWDMSPCLRALTETLEGDNEAQKKLKKRMSYLVLVAMPNDPEVAGSEAEVCADEERPLLPVDENKECSTSSSQREDSKITTNYSLVPEASLPAQDKAYQLLLTYSAAYVKLLVSDKLSGPSHHRLRPHRNHCSTVSLCLCQYIKTKTLLAGVRWKPAAPHWWPRTDCAPVSDV
ncbi:transmembrane protein 268 [Genypterus blacodes]|uniref:transmembrane protein 268 n=1 Tax=Genypterus blacodes TaxID=154954 RepID=UPI003F76515F